MTTAEFNQAPIAEYEDIENMFPEFVPVTDPLPQVLEDWWIESAPTFTKTFGEDPHNDYVQEERKLSNFN